MRSPVSSCLVLGGQEALECVVFGGVVGDVFLPAVPDDEEPGAGEDAYGVGVVVSSVAGSLVEVGGPGVGVARVAGEGGDGVAQLFVAGPSEGDGSQFARLSGGGGGAGEAGQRFGGGELGAAVADLGQQPCGADLPGAGQGREDVPVGVRGQLGADLFLQGLDLLDEGEQHS